jgi:hypothetical protein
MQEIKNANILIRTHQRKDHFEDVGIDGRIILKQGMKLWSGLKYIRHDDTPTGSIKEGNFKNTVPQH